jgi:hypothetical protein
MRRVSFSLIFSVVLAALFLFNTPVLADDGRTIHGDTSVTNQARLAVRQFTRELRMNSRHLVAPPVESDVIRESRGVQAQMYKLRGTGVTDDSNTADNRAKYLVTWFVEGLARELYIHGEGAGNQTGQAELYVSPRFIDLNYKDIQDFVQILTQHYDLSAKTDAYVTIRHYKSGRLIGTYTDDGLILSERF